MYKKKKRASFAITVGTTYGNFRSIRPLMENAMSAGCVALITIELCGHNCYNTCHCTATVLLIGISQSKIRGR